MAILVLTPNGKYVTKATLEDAVAAADTYGKTIVVTALISVLDNLIIPSTVALEIVNGGIISVATGKTLTINGVFTSVTGAVFIGAGAVVFGAITSNAGLVANLSAVIAAGTGFSITNPTITTPTITTPTITTPTITNYTETLYAPSAGSSFAVNLANGTIQKFTTNANTSIVLPASVAGKSYTIIVALGGTHTVTFSGGTTIKWSGGSAPPTSASANWNIYCFTCDGTYTFGCNGGRSF